MSIGTTRNEVMPDEPGGSRDERRARLLARYVESLNSGDLVAIESLLKRHPELGYDLRQELRMVYRIRRALEVRTLWDG